MGRATSTATSTVGESDRIFLRRFHAADLDAMTRVFADPEVMRFGPGTQSREWIAKWLKGCLEDYDRKWGFGLWAVVERDACRVVGFCGLTRFGDIEGRPGIELGYRLGRVHWGRGLATEAAQAARDHAFHVLGLTRLIALIDTRNLASIRVAEKVGLPFEKEVVFRGRRPLLYAVQRPDHAVKLRER